MTEEVWAEPLGCEPWQMENTLRFILVKDQVFACEMERATERKRAAIKNKNASFQC